MPDERALLVKTAAELLAFSEVLANLMVEVAMMAPNPEAALEQSIAAEEVGSDSAVQALDLTRPAMREIQEAKEKARSRLFHLSRQILRRRLARERSA